MFHSVCNESIIIYGFHFLKWVTKIIDLFHVIPFFWDLPVILFLTISHFMATEEMEWHLEAWNIILEVWKLKSPFFLNTWGKMSVSSFFAIWNKEYMNLEQQDI